MIRKLLACLLAMALLLGALPIASLAEETVLFTDSAGREVEVPKAIAHFAPSGPLAQIMLFALAPESFVGLASEWSPEAEAYLGDYYALPVLGQFYGSNADMNLEQLIAADPQIIIDVGEAKKTIVEDMDALSAQVGIPAVHIAASTKSYAETYRMLGKLLGLEARAEELAQYCEKIYARAEEILQKVGEENKVKAIYCLGDDGLNVIAKGSFQGEIMDLLTDNQAVVAEVSSKGTGNAVDMEQMLLWDPEYIVFAPQSAYAQVGDDPAWQEIRAVKEGKYVETPFGPYNWMGFPPSVQRYLGILWLCDLFYPDQTEYDLYEEIARYYSLFYHCDLTQAQFDDLMQNARFKAE